MRAIVIAVGQTAFLSPIDERYPTPLLRLVDRPFIQHVVERLLRQGVEDFDFVLHYLPHKIEQFLGNGERWGCRFTFHLAKDLFHPYDVLRSMDFSKEDPILVAHADRLPQINPVYIARTHACPILLIDRAFEQDRSPFSRWSGWAIVNPPILASLPEGLTDEQFYSHLLSLQRSDSPGLVAPECLSARNYEELLISNRKVIHKQFTELCLSGQEIEDGVWLSRNVTLHPTVKLTPPVYLGEDCRIEPGCQLGPTAVIGNHCVIDAKSQIKDALVFPGSYVGCGLEIKNSLVDKNCLLNMDIGAALVVADEFILANLQERKLYAFLMKVLSRALGVFALIAASPLIAAAALYRKITRGTGIVWKEVLCLPASPDREQWKTFRLARFVDETPTSYAGDFFLRFLPGLYHVAKGELSFVGVPPRTPSEVEALPSDWKHLYLESKPGLITEALVYFGTQVSDDDNYSAETFYAVSSGFRRDFHLLLRYVGFLLGIIKPNM